MELCPCGSGLQYAECCEPLIRGERQAETAEQLMRSRYSAYARVEMDYLLATLHPDHREDHDAEGARDWAEKSEWRGLTILNTRKGAPEDTEGEVEFTADFAYNGNEQRHHERAHFEKVDGKWYFVAGKAFPIVRAEPKVGRNDPCPCGSGKKYKKCCGRE
ncbi:MAG: YchJ family protein [Chloroflexi bacterium]|nr:YchJ family protein [Chloroflexota bacterium]